MITLNKSISLTYDYAGLFIAHEEWIHPRRQIDTWELIYVLSGTIFIQQEEAYTVSKGELLLLQPALWHAGFKTSPAGTAFYWVHFTVSDFAALGFRERHLVFADGYKFTPLFKQLLHMANSPIYPSYGAELVLGTILIEAVSPCMGQEQTSLIKNCAEWIRINSDRKLTVPIISDHFNYHADYLCTLFRRMLGVTLKQYIDVQRIQYIKNILVTSNYSIKQLSNYLGWENENQFNHYFKYHENMSPSQYRSLYINTHFNKK